MAWFPQNTFPLQFGAYHDIPKNLEGFYSKFHPRDPQRTVEEQIKIFEIAITDMQVGHEDITCCLFPHSLGKEAFYCYINFPRGSITSWDLMKNASLQKYKILISLSELYQQFMSIRRKVNEPIGSFNDHFHRAFIRL